MKKIILGILVSLTTVAIVLNCINAILVKSVDNVRTDFFNVICNKKEDGCDYGALLKYDYTRFFEINSVDNLALKITSVFHNFKEGYINVVYSFDINKHNKNHRVGAEDIKSKWYIRKNGERWIVYYIDETS